jgi:hypothetical protein
MIKSGSQSDAESDILPPPTWTRERSSSSSSLRIKSEDALSDDVNDKIAHQCAELERGRELGLNENGISQVTVTNLTREPMVINRTELTPIMETSPRESLASDYAEQIASHLVSPKGRVNDLQNQQTSLSRSSSIKRPASPATSNHSVDKNRTASLTSQADRLRNKFLNRKTSVESDFGEEPASGRLEKENKMKFESLIRSGETMRMSLTPTTLRSIEVLQLYFSV